MSTLAASKKKPFSFTIVLVDGLMDVSMLSWDLITCSSQAGKGRKEGIGLSSWITGFVSNNYRAGSFL
jgi:hypothetical protein